MPNDPIEQKIWNAIKSRLVAAQVTGQKLDYVDSQIFEGIRENFPSGAFPLIVMEPDDETESDHTSPLAIKITERTLITVMIEHIDPDKQIIGDGTIRGIKDIVADVKNVLAADPKLGLAADGVLKIQFPTTRYFVDNYPIREAVITAEVNAVVGKASR